MNTPGTAPVITRSAPPRPRRSGKWKWIVAIVTIVITATLTIGAFTEWYGLRHVPTPVGVTCIDQRLKPDNDKQDNQHDIEEYLGGEKRTECFEAMMKAYGTTIADGLIHGKYGSEVLTFDNVKTADGSFDAKPKGYYGPGSVATKNGYVSAGVFWNGQQDTSKQYDFDHSVPFTSLGIINRSNDTATRVWFQGPDSSTPYWRASRISSDNKTQVTDNSHFVQNSAPAKKNTPSGPTTLAELYQWDRIMFGQFEANVKSYDNPASASSSSA
jgi:hypothetical protein